MTATDIMNVFQASSQNFEARVEAVNALRHLTMDEVKFDVKDDDMYTTVYTQIMERIASDHPSLSGEVKRQMAKKIRRHESRRLLDRS